MNIWAVTDMANSAAGTTALSWVLRTEVVAKYVFEPLTDHTARLVRGVPARFDPVIVKVRSELPADALVGEIALMETDPDEGLGVGAGSGECGAEYPPPQPDPPMTKAKTDVPVILNSGLVVRWSQFRSREANSGTPTPH